MQDVEQRAGSKKEKSKAQIEAEAVFNQKIAEQKRVLKGLSKNQLIRIIVEMSVRAFYQQATIEDLQAQTRAANKQENTDNLKEEQ